MALGSFRQREPSDLLQDDLLIEGSDAPFWLRGLKFYSPILALGIFLGLALPRSGRSELLRSYLRYNNQYM